MNSCVLDTDMLSLVEDAHPRVSQRFLRSKPGEVAITVLTVEEQLSAWYTELRKAKRPERLAWAYRRLAETTRFLARLEILVYDEAAMAGYQQLREQKVKIRRMDLRIAATVLRHQAILITRNARDFRQVPGLQFEDWSK